MSIALHPPKYHSAGNWLEQYTSCPGAVAAVSVVIVFTNEEQMTLFKQGLGCMHPDVPSDAWVGVVAYSPKAGWTMPAGSANQIIAAYKKWFGVVHMMDMDVDAPEYGLMVDSELLVFDGGGERRSQGPGCAKDGPWSQLLARLKGKEASKSFPAARVSTTLTTYQFQSFTRSGADYDKVLIQENANWVSWAATCRKNPNERRCKEIMDMIDKVLFSWWTDVPWMNLEVAGRMLQARGGPVGKGGYRQLAAGMRFPRFEHISYQQWCVLHEGFTIRDVTAITGEAKWGSYMEDPLPGARLAELEPLWISGDALERVESGSLPALNMVVPPLWIFHADKGRSRADRDGNRERWRRSLKESVMLHGKGSNWDKIDQSDW